MPLPTYPPWAGAPSDFPFAKPVDVGPTPNYVLRQQTSAVSGAASTAQAIALGVNVLPGSLLVFAMAGDKNTGQAHVPIPSAGWGGFVPIYQDLSTSVSLYLFWKHAIGSSLERSFTVSWDLSSAVGNTLWYAEYVAVPDVDGGVWQPSALPAHTVTNEGTVLIQNTGTTGLVANKGVAIAVAAMDSGQSATSGGYFDSGFATLFRDFPGTGRGGLYVGERIAQEGERVSSNFQFAGTVDQVSAAVACFAKVIPAAIPAPPPPPLLTLPGLPGRRPLILDWPDELVLAVAGGGVTYQEEGSLIAGALLSGDDVSEHAETGALTTAGLASGADAAEHAETAALIAGTFGSGADVYTASETGAITTGGLLAGPSQKIGGGKTGAIMASGLLSGADVAEHSEAGTLSAGGLVSGADVYTAAEAGSLVAGGLLSGADVHEAAETGAIIAGALLAGTDATIHAELGSLIAGALLAGVDATIHSETGSLTTQGLLSGVQAKDGAGKAGSLTAGGLASGADSVTHTEAGSLLAGTFGSAADAHTAVETGSLVAGALLSGADVHIAVEGGSLIASGMVAGETDTSPPVVVFFGQPRPRGGMGIGSPEGGVGVGNPQGGGGEGSPSGDFYGKPNPGQVRT
jgi:hypothetical protein